MKDIDFISNVDDNKPLIIGIIGNDIDQLASTVGDTAINIFKWFSDNQFFCLLRPTLGHCRGSSLTNPMLITAFTISTGESPEASYRGWVPKSGQAPRAV